MAEELLINVTPMECRVALLDNGNVNEIYIERAAKLGLVSNIYKGTVVRVLPGMQAAFVDIGLSRTAFLHASDMVRLTKPRETTDIDDHSDTLDVIDAGHPSAETHGASGQSTNSRAKPVEPKIQERLHAGDVIMVQVVKDMLGTKGARLTTNISLPSRFLVYLPYSDHIGISQRIEDMADRERIKQKLTELMDTHGLTGGLIARTVAEDADDKKLNEDIDYLAQLWQVIQTRKKTVQTGLIYSELPLPERTVRDLANADTQRIHIDSQEVFERVTAFADQFVPSMQNKISLYRGEQPLFDVHRVEDDLQNALKRRVDLKSGGYLIIDQTEAMTTIDVNTGSFVGGRSLEDTVYKTNLEATHVIARQLRMRNLGGIIIIDFIDMLEQAHRDSVLESLQAQLERDHAKNCITQVSELGLVEMTRKRTRESLEQLLCEPCKTCQGRGYIKTVETVCYEIFREIMRCARAYDKSREYTVVAHNDVIDVLLSTEASSVADLEHFIGGVISFQVEPMYTQEQYDIVLG